MSISDTVQSTDPLIAKTVTVKNIQLHIQSKRRWGLARQYYLEFSVGDSNTPRLTKALKESENRTSWDEKWCFVGDDIFTLVVRVRQKHRFGMDKVIASLTDTVGGVSQELSDGVFEKTLENTADGSGSGITLRFSFTAELRAADIVNAATKAVEPLGSAPAGVSMLSTVVGMGTNVIAGVQAFDTTWGVLLERIALFNRIVIVTDIAAIHPYISLAWSVISAANQLLVKQKERDERIIRLAGTMSDVFEFVHDAEPLKAINAHMKTITLLIQQVTECGYFITEYTKQKSFWIRTAKYTFSDIDARVDHYETRLRDLKSALLDQVTLQSGITVTRTMNVVERTGENIDPNDMPYAFGATYAREKGNLPGTHGSLIGEMISKITCGFWALCVCIFFGIGFRSLCNFKLLKSTARRHE